MRNKLAIILMTKMTLGLLAGCSTSTSKTSNADSKENTQTQASGEEQKQDNQELLSGIYTAEIVIKDKGSIIVEMDADKAPITVTNFVNLVKDGFYDGLTFHRIIDGFMMQGGDPLGNGTGGSDQEIKGEFAANGITNDQSHTRGAISMARAKKMDSASSQFFIVHEDSTFLDGQYACFGYVTEGMEIVDDICTTTSVTDNNGSVKPENQPVIESIKIIE